MNVPESPLARRLTLLGRLLAVVPALVGGAHLVAWLTGVMENRGITSITMKTNTSLCLLLGGAALLLLVPDEAHAGRRWAARACAAITLLVGVLTLSEHVVGWNLRIDELLASEPATPLGVTAPNRMGPPASMCSTLAGLALLLLSRRNRRGVRAAQGLALAVCLIALVPTIGYLYQAQELYGVARYTGIAWPTALSLLALGLGLFVARSSDGLMLRVTANDPGGAIIRRLVPATVLVPIGLGWLHFTGERLSWFDAATGTAITIVVFILAFSALAWLTGRSVGRSATALRDSEESRKVAEAVQAERQRLNDVLETLPVYVVLLSRDYHVPFANRFFRERFGESHGKRCFEYLFNRTEPCEICETYTVVKTHAPHRWEWTGPDGRNYDIYDFPFTDSDGSPLIMEMGIDITERKRAEGALKDVNETLEQRVAERTEELRASNAELTRFNQAAVGRELRMIALKKELNEVCLQAGQPPRYRLEVEEEQEREEVERRQK